MADDDKVISTPKPSYKEMRAARRSTKVAAPKLRPGFRHTDVTREKIQIGSIVARLEKCALGKLHMTLAQIRAASILLNKSLPDLIATDVSATFEHRFVVEAPQQLTRREWEDKYTLPDQQKLLTQ